MKQSMIALAAAITLAGCGGAPPPDYGPPTDAQAFAAEAASVALDVAEPLPVRKNEPITSGAIDVPGAMARNTGNVLQDASDAATRQSLKEGLRSLRKVVVRTCEWGSVKAKDVESFSRARLSEVEHAYLCEVDRYSDPPRRGPVKSTATGYYYMDGGGFLHGDVDSTTWEDVDAIP
ncbi:MAG TPA: hypothetical protein VGB60_11360 [Brevundimonas sp.]|jgi:predicted small lipoprotein YifL|uniref:hypothetical protein n=1 Tax=Brevundimonas sp. TaxID=1871086 RepID=UPI002EDB5874